MCNVLVVITFVTEVVRLKKELAICRGTIKKLEAEKKEFERQIKQLKKHRVNEVKEMDRRDGMT